MRNDPDDLTVNPCHGPSLLDAALADPSRRRALAGGAAALAGLLGTQLAGCAATPRMAGDASTDPAPAAGVTPGFRPVPASAEDTVRVPEGYEHRVVHAWGDPVDGRAPAFRPDASNSAEEQARQVGMHHDGMHFFPLPRGSRSSTEGLLVTNHEYADPGLLFTDGHDGPMTPARAAKILAAHGVSVTYLKLEGGRWRLQPSRFARRLTAATPMRVSGPAAGHALLRTAADPTGTRVLGTINNCSHGVTPWGTYLACEENFNHYFGVQDAAWKPADAAAARYGLSARGAGYRLHEADARFDLARTPNEPHRFGWVVEFDPFDPEATPVKRTALGRIKHEGAIVRLAADGRAVVYTGDDQVNEYVYKFVSRRSAKPGDAAANRDLLDDGTLFVARFDAGGRGEWLPLVHGQRGLTAENGFPDQATVLVNARLAADRVGGTRMDRPEWIAAHPGTGEMYVSLTNNVTRGTDRGAPVDEANPRAENRFGHIARWREAGGDAAATTFEWDLFLLAGNPASTWRARRGNVNGDAFGSPDGLWFDPSGLLWIQTDVSTNTIDSGVYAGIGHNQMLAADVRTGEVRRFLTGPAGCEVTGVVMTPDRRWMFVNIQHPGETATESPNRPDAATWRSHWPDGGMARPRSATIAIRKRDGGTVGS